MTKEEIKQQYSMRDIVARYGLQPNRAGFIRCPFHQGDRTASMKLYARDFHCFGCGANGDIFTFAQLMEHCDFKTAFLMLGGEYKEPSFQLKMAVYRARKQREDRDRKASAERQKLLDNILLISVFRRFVEWLPPLSEGWTEAYNRLQLEIYKNEQLSRKEGDG